MQNGGQYTDTLGMDKSIVLYVGEKESADDDGLARRLKNRERQRRYRETKRHEANLKKASTVDQATPLHNMRTELQAIHVQVDVLVNLNSPARVHSRRDWKKDARSAYVQKKQEDGSLVPDNLETTTLDGTLAPISQSDFSAKHNNPSHCSISSKRNWKAEARNKKTLE